MRYDQLPQTAQITAINSSTGATQVFPSTPVVNGLTFTVPFGSTAHMLGASNAGHRIGHATSGRAVHIPNLITCAAAVYVYTNGAGVVHGVAVFHAHTGLIPPEHSPMQPGYNHWGALAANVHVVFASSQSMNTTPAAGIQTAADGLFTILGDGVPLANIRVVTGTGTFGANAQGDVGISSVAVWPGGNLQQTFLTAVANAGNDYQAQFPAGQTTMGFMGSGHNLTLGNQRIATLTGNLNAARTDQQVVNAMRNFLTGPNSYKNGSLKLFMVRRIYNAIRILPMANVTSANARAIGVDILSGIEQGRY